MLVVGLVAFWYSDIWSADVLRGVVFPLVGTFCALYLMVAVTVLRYRRRIRQPSTNIG